MTFTPVMTYPMSAFLATQILMGTVRSRQGTFTRASDTYRDPNRLMTGRIRPAEISDTTRRKRLQYWLDRTESNEAFLQALKNHGIAKAWLGGPMAQGMEIRASEKLCVHVRAKCGQTLDGDTLARLQDAIGKACEIQTVLHQASQNEEPDATVTLILR